ncbi:hypothetical protein F4804DRAFT_315866 [Jackrogersella minutella]|nr:hypothetical protein F4804DRAFT_315866 [Jackrogersella minutella]
MSQQEDQRWSFSPDLFGNEVGITDDLPASYHSHEGSGKQKRRVVANPAHNIEKFLEQDLSLGSLEHMLKHLWFAGAKHVATQLHFQVAMGREVVLSDRMDLHLLWDNDGRIYMKPIPRYLLCSTFWQDYLKCPHGCGCENQGPEMSCTSIRGVAFGFFYTYICLISSETDFLVANEKHLLPRNENGSAIEWAKWKEFSRKVLGEYRHNRIHKRFLRAELRLSRINTINRFTRLPPFGPYLRGWRNYNSFFRNNLSWMTASTVFIALVLTAMQVGLATDRLNDNESFQRASYGFTVFSILGPICAFGLVILGALYNLVKDLPWLLTGARVERRGDASQNTNENTASQEGAGPSQYLTTSSYPGEAGNEDRAAHHNLDYIV